MKKLRLALLNLYDGVPNQGMRALREILDTYSSKIEYTEFDVRGKYEIPDTSFDIYISSGGPGNPTEGDGIWNKNWNNLVQELWTLNKNTADPKDRKYMFFICHSFQMACNYFGLGSITRRQSTSFGIYPCHKTASGKKDILLNGVEDRYFVFDSRDWQLVQPRLKIFRERGARILSLEKMRDHVEYERAIMAVRFSPEFVGTQYHPEADPEGMKIHFSKPENKAIVVKNHSLQKYTNMMKSLADPERVEKTYHSVIPGFIEDAIVKLTTVESIHA